jgi:putative ABC transport system permease protein
MMFGEFYTDDSASTVVIRWDALKRMGLIVEDSEHPVNYAAEDSAGDTRVVPPDSVLGRKVQVISATLDVSSIAADPMRVLAHGGQRPFAESITEFTIGGILKRPSTFSDDKFDGGVLVPLKAAERIPRLGFSSVWDLLRDDGRAGQYTSIYVRVRTPSDIEAARDSIEAMGLNVFSISDELKEIRRAFMIVDSVLGAIGTIALLVAALGIANTMVMSILERTREIGVMKAIGASDSEVRLIFFVEAATIGLFGAFFGLILGWLVTRVANLVVNVHLLPEGEQAVNLFYFPVWLIAGAIGFSLIISLIAGLYPAARAARVDPVTALRHD